MTLGLREMLESVGQDFAYAMRAMRRAPGFTLAAVSTIALGIGANTAVFSLLQALLLQPLDATSPHELVRVYTSEGRVQQSASDRFGGSSYADYADLRATPALAGLAALMPLGASVRLNDAVSRFEARVVSDNFFDVIGRPPARGGWRAGDTDANAPEVIVSHRFWTTALASDPSVIGRPLVVNTQTVYVVGVTAAAFRGVEAANVDLYFPFRLAPILTGRADFLMDHGARSVKLLGRLAHGATPQSAEAALNGTMRAIGDQFPASNAGRTISVRAATSIVPMEVMGGGVLPTAGLVLGATLVMLAISGVNVAAVLLARTIRRRRELAVRTSLGAGRWRIVRQLVTESVALAFAAGVVVIGLVSMLPALAAQIGVPAAMQPATNVTVLVYAVAVSLGFGVVFGLVPALIGMRADVVEVLRGSSHSARPSRARAQRGLVCAQLALSMLLLIVGGALLSSLDQQQRVDPGFAADKLVVASFEDPAGTTNRNRSRAFTQLAVQRLGAMPGVTSVSVASMAPLTSDGMRSTIHIDGYAEQAGEDMEVPVITAGPDFFRTLRIPMQRGRELTWSDHDTLSRVVVNQAMARRYWGARDPVGSVVRLGGGVPAEVIGVAADARFISLGEPPKPMYVIQRADEGGETVLIRARDDATALVLAVRGAMSRSDMPFTLVQLRTMDEILRGSLTVTRAVSDTLMTIGVLAVLLAAMGLYGVVAYVMAGRTREFGVRLALGASPSSIARLVLGYGVRLAIIGGVAGMTLGLGALRLIQGLLFGASTSLPMMAAVTAVLAAVTLVACAVPAMRATATSPASALRSE